MNGRNAIKKIWPYIVSPLICFLIIMVHCFVRKAWIFGDLTMLNGDAAEQYIYYMSEIWHKLHDGDSMFFSWNVEMGIDSYLNMFGYVMQPLHIIVWIFPWEMIQDTMQFVMVLRFCLLAFSMVYYLLHTERNHITCNKNLIVVVLSLCYTLSGIMIADYVQISWWTAFILFPYLILAFERFFDHGKWKGYYILLVLEMIFNLYLAYVMCIFLILYFLCQSFNGKRDFLKKIMHFSLVSIFAAISSAFSLIVSTVGLGSRYVDDNNGFSVDRLNDSVATIAQWVKGSFLYDNITEIYDATPHIYMGEIVGIVLVVYVFLPIQRFEKLRKSIMSVIILSGFFIGPLSYVWHAFVIPNGYYYRFSMVWIFFAMYICMEAFPYLNKLRIRYILISTFVAAAFFVYGFMGITDYMEFYIYLIGIMLFVFLMIMLVLMRRKSIKETTYITIVSILTIIELCVNSYLLFDYYATPPVESRKYNSQAIKLAKMIDLENGERIELSNTDMDLGMWINKNTINGFASVSNGGVLKLFTMLGLSQFAAETGGECRGCSPLLNYMFNIKYCMGLYDSTFSDVEEIEHDQKMKLYKVKRESSLGYMVDETVLEWNPVEEQLFDGQNAFVKKAVGEDSFLKVLPREATVEVGYGTLKEKDNGKYSFVVIDDMTGVLVTYIVPEDMDLYMYSDIDKDYGFRQIKVDGEIVYEDDEYRTTGTVHVGKVKKGQKVTLMQIVIKCIGQEAEFQYQFASYDDEQYEKIYEKLSESTLKVDTFEDTYIKGTIDAKKDGIMMTSIPAKDGFSVYVDGNKTEFEAVGNAFIGVPLSAGNHTIEFRYATPYVKESAIISLIGLFAFVVICFIEKIVLKKQDDVKIA